MLITVATMGFFCDAVFVALSKKHGLEITPLVLAAVQADGSLDRSIAANQATARAGASVLARAIVAERPRLATDIEKSVQAFVDHAIGKMVTICRAIRTARGSLP